MNIFKNKYQEFRSGFSLLSVLVVMLISQLAISILVETILIFAYQGDFYRIYQVITPTVSNILNYVIYSAEIGAVLLLFYLLYKRPLRQMGLRKDKWFTQLLLGCLYGIVLMGIVVGILVLTQNADISRIQMERIITPEFISSFIFFVFVGFFEEILCRGYMMTALKTTRNKWVILLCPAVIFGVMHALNPSVTLFSILNIVLAGILFGYLMIKTERIWASIGLHITWNFFQGNVFGIPVSGTESFSLMETTFTGSDWITGGEFGAEGGAVCTVILLLAIAFVHFVIKSPEQKGWTVDSDMPLTRSFIQPNTD